LFIIHRIISLSKGGSCDRIYVEWIAPTEKLIFVTMAKWRSDS